MSEAVFYCFNFRGWRRDKFEKTIEVIPFSAVRDPMVNIQIIPDKTVHSGRAVESILNTFHSMHEGVMDRFWADGFSIVLKSKDFASFRIVYEKGRISFHLSVPKSFQKTVEHSVHNVWPKATIRAVPADYINRLDASLTSAAFLELRDHYFKSTLVDRTKNEPLPSLIAAGRNLIDDDLAVLDVSWVPISDRSWHEKARSARNKFRKGREPMKTPSKWTDILFLFADFLVDGVIEKAFGLLDSAFGAENKKKKVDFTRAGRELRPSTEQKFTHSGFNTIIRIASQSKQPTRADKNLTAIGTAFKDVSADNEWEIKPVPKDGRFSKSTTRFVRQLKDDKLPPITLNANVQSIPEASQIMQLPTGLLQEEYPEIEQTTFREQRLPAQITDSARPGSVPLGETTGVEPIKVNIPGGMSESEKDDRCTPGIAVGGQGSGKTVFGTNQGVYWFGCHLPYDEWLDKGRTVFLYDVTGGKTIKDFLSVCPPDRRHRVHVVDYGLADRRPALNWSVPGMDAETAGDLAAQTIEFIELVTQYKMGPQTHRWVTIHSMAVFEASSENTPLEVVQSLTSDSFRGDKIIPNVKDRAVLRDLAVFAAMSPEQRAQIINPIMNRYYKLTTNKRLWECVAQRPLRDQSGDLALDYRRFMDAEGGPHAVLINVPPADKKGRIIPPEVQQALMLGESSKLWAATLTRNPMDSGLKEYLVLYDEPHQFMKGTPFFKRMFREIRKYRGRPLLLFHEWEAIRDRELKAAILGADPNLHLLKGADANFEKLASYVSPFVLDEFMAMPKYYAINRLKAGASSHVFMCRLTAPVNEPLGKEKKTILPVYPVDEFWNESAASLSRPVDEVRDDIFNREGDVIDVEMLANAENNNTYESHTPVEGADLDCLKD